MGMQNYGQYTKFGRAWLDTPNDRWRLYKTWTGDPPAVGETKANDHVYALFDVATTGVQTSLYGINRMNRLTIGSVTPARGSVIADSINIQVQDYNSAGAGGGTSEVGAHFNALNPWSAKTNHDANYWFTDWNLYGPASGQEKFLGAAFMLAKYNAGETLDATHFGAYGFHIMSRPQGGGGKDDGFAGLTSYRVRAVYAFSGWAGPQTANDGTHAAATSASQYIFAAGIPGGIWLGNAARSKYGGAFYATDFLDYALRVGPRHPDNTGHAIYVESGAGNVGIGLLPLSTIALRVGYSSSANIAARFQNDDPGNVGAIVDLYHNSASPANNDVIGQLRGVGFSSTGVERIYGASRWVANDVTNAAEQGRFNIQVLVAGTLTSVVNVTATGLALANAGAGLTVNSATMLTTTTAFTNGAAAAAGTLANAPAAGNPTKWIPINDNGTTRYIPAW